MGPSINQISEMEHTDDYTDSWSVKGQYPNHSTSSPIQKSATSEKSLGGSVEILATPKATVQAGAKRDYLSEFPTQAAGIDIERSMIAITPVGGLEWKYVFRKIPRSALVFA